MAITYLKLPGTKTYTASMDMTSSPARRYVDNTGGSSAGTTEFFSASGELKWFYQPSPSPYTIDAKIGTGFSDVNNIGPPATITWYLDYSASISINGATPTTDTALYATQTTPMSGFVLDQTGPAFSGTVTMEVDAEPWVMYYNFPDVYGPGGASFPLSAVKKLSTAAYITNDGRAFPDYSADYPGYCPGGFPDGLQACGAFGFWKTVSGAAITATASCNGATATQTYTPSSQLILEMLVEQNVDQGPEASKAGSVSGSTSAQAYTNSTLVAEGTFSRTYSGTNVSSSASNIGGISLSGSASGDGSTPTSYAASTSINQAVTSPAQFQLNPYLRWFDGSASGYTVDYQQAYNGSAPVMAQTTGTASFKQRRGGGTAYIGGTYYTLPTFAEWIPVRAWLDESSLTANGDEINDWRLQFAGLPFDSFTLAQAASTEVLGAETVTGSTGGPYTPIVAGWEGYRYLQFTADQAGSMVLTTAQSLTKTFSWTVSSPGTPETVTLDLCAPDSWNQDSSTLPAVDERQSRYPLNSSTGYPDEVNQASSTDAHGFLHDSKGARWGMFQVSSITVNNPSGSTMNLGAMSLVRQTSSDVSFLGMFPPYVTDTYGGTQVDQIQTVIHSDHRRFDFPALNHLPGTSWADYTLTNLISFINGISGWTATAAGSFPDSYHTNSQPAEWAAGNGATFSAGSPTYWLEVPVNASTVTVIAQEILDEVWAPPGFGDVMTGGSFGDTTNLNVCKYLRARAQGLVMSASTGKPASGQTVYVTKDPNAGAEGSGTSGADGWYETGTPYAKGGITSDVFPGSYGSSTPTFVGTLHNRWLRRLSFNSALSTSAPWIALDDWGGYHLAYVDSAGNVLYDYSSVSRPSWIWSNEVTTGGGWSNPRMCVKQNFLIELRAIKGNNSYRMVSNDYGKTFSTPSLIMSATLSDVACSSDGAVFEVNNVPDSGTSGPSTFQGRFKGSGDSAFGSAFTLKDGTGANLHSDGSGFGIDFETAVTNRWILTFIVDGESAPSVWWSLDDGATFTRFS